MAIGFLQGTGVQSSGSVASVSKAFTSNVAAGSLLVVGVHSDTTAIASATVTDTLNGSHAAANTGVAANGQRAGIFYTANSAGGACTVTFDSGTDFMTLGIAEFSGAATTTPLNANNSGSGTSAAPATSTLATTGTTVLVGTMTHASAQQTLTPGTGFFTVFGDETVDALPIQMEYKIGANGTLAATWTAGASVVWGASAAAFSEAAGAADPFPAAYRRLQPPSWRTLLAR